MVQEPGAVEGDGDGDGDGEGDGGGDGIRKPTGLELVRKLTASLKVGSLLSGG